MRKIKDLKRGSSQRVLKYVGKHGEESEKKNVRPCFGQLPGCLTDESYPYVKGAVILNYGRGVKFNRRFVAKKNEKIVFSHLWYEDLLKYMEEKDRGEDSLEKGDRRVVLNRG